MADEWQIVFTQPAERDLARLGLEDRKRVLDTLERLVADPAATAVNIGVVKVVPDADEYRLRVGRLRVHFTLREDRHVVVLDVGSMMAPV